jgi:hypothetical protein
VHAVVEVHDTPPKLLDVAPVGLGASWVDQLVPFQRSARALSLLAPITEEPTAVQTVAELHEIPLSLLDAESAGLGVDWTDQLVPFQRNAKVRSLT